jgi:energy-coupling factor transport system ATP-binding protein
VPKLRSPLGIDGDPVITVITIDQLSYTYPGGARAVRDLSLTIPDGAFVLVTGVSGAGKSTLLRALNGLVPQFYGGQVSGSIQVDGQNTLEVPTRTLARSVGFVFQDPEAQFIVQTVEDEISFGMENLGTPPAEMTQRIDEVLTMLGISHLRRRQVSTLSGGEAQRVAIASALVLRPRHLILDEPTSQLDPATAHTLLDALVTLNRTHHLTIILAEHRLERVLAHATHLLHLGSEQAIFGSVREVLPQVPLRPPLVEVALRLGWQPIPLTIEDARAFVARGDTALTPERLSPANVGNPPPEGATRGVTQAIQVEGLVTGYAPTPILNGFTWGVDRGEIVGLLGVNGSGKSTLLKSLVGLLVPRAGEIRIGGRSIRGRAVSELAQHIGYVPQNPNSVLFAETLREEVAFTLRNHSRSVDSRDQIEQADQVDQIEGILARFGLAGHAARYPRDLSGGERQRAALAAMLATEPPILLLDEPTRGLDYLQKQRLAMLIRGWAVSGKVVVVATHDVEWIAGLAMRCTVLDRGQIIADGPTAAVLLTTPGFNTQLGDLFGDPRRMTPNQAQPPDAALT